MARQTSPPQELASLRQPPQALASPVSWQPELALQQLLHSPAWWPCLPLQPQQQQLQGKLHSRAQPWTSSHALVPTQPPKSRSLVATPSAHWAELHCAAFPATLPGRTRVPPLHLPPWLCAGCAALCTL